MNPLPAWTPFVRVNPYLSVEKRKAIIAHIQQEARAQGVELSRADIEQTLIEERENQEMYRNSRYTVIVIRTEEPWYDTAPKVIHLSIRRNDRKRPGPERYRDFQRIKTELVGPNHEGVELYPSEDRVADCADQYHIYVLADPELEFPFGFRAGFRAGPGKGSPVAQTAFEE